jgi:hypothetical protein
LTRYKVTQSLVGMHAGQVVTAAELAGCNIAALVEGGHLTVVTDSEPVRTRKKEPYHGA